MNIWALMLLVVVACICCSIAESKGWVGFTHLLLSLVLLFIAVFIILLYTGDPPNKVYGKGLSRVKAQEEVKNCVL